MRSTRRFLVLLPLALLGACGLWPTEDDIEDSLEQELRSAAGDWGGQTTGADPVVLEFRLVETGTQLQGSGTMREGGAAAVPITVSGTFQRPALSLSFSGMRYEGRAVTGQVRADYTGVVVAESLRLTGDGYARGLPVILSER